MDYLTSLASPVTTPIGNYFGWNADQTNFLGAILIIIIVLTLFVPRRYWNPLQSPFWRSPSYLASQAPTVPFPLPEMVGGSAPFVPAQPWVEAPEYPSPYRLNQFYLGGPSKCFSCEQDIIKRGASPQLGRHTRCFDCEKQAVKGQRDGFQSDTTDFGMLNGQPYSDQVNVSGVGLPTIYGRADGLTQHEVTSQNPMNYGLTIAS